MCVCGFYKKGYAQTDHESSIVVVAGLSRQHLTIVLVIHFISPYWLPVICLLLFLLNDFSPQFACSVFSECVCVCVVALNTLV